jgi:hypothetical protein
VVPTKDPSPGKDKTTETTKEKFQSIKVKPVKGKKKETTKEKLQSIKVKPVKGKKKETATKRLVPPGSKTKARHHRSVLEDGTTDEPFESAVRKERCAVNGANTSGLARQSSNTSSLRVSAVPRRPFDRNDPSTF